MANHPNRGRAARKRRLLANEVNEMPTVDKAKLADAVKKLNEELKAEGKSLQQSEFDQKSAALEKMRQRQQQQSAK